MAFLDGLKRNPAPTPAIDSLPANVKENAVEAARPAAKLMDQATTPKEAPVSPDPTPNNPAKGRSLGMER